MKKITIFCSAANVDNIYIESARKLAKLMVENKYDLVWGGSDSGLMSVVSQEVKCLGGKIFGVSVEFLKSKAATNADEMYIAKDLAERKEKMVDKGGVILVMVGGIGTLDEIMTVLEMKKHSLFVKPVVILNTNNFYEGFKLQLNKMRDGGFIPKPLEELLYFADTPEDVIKYLSESQK
jgi:hypothetical protein